MKSDMRVVIDTGVVVSAVLLPRSVPRRAFDAALSGARLLISEVVIVELNEVLRRPKFNRYVAEPQRLEFLAALVQSAEVVEVGEEIKACRDPDDDKFLTLAVNGHASHILSGDADLLALNPFRGIAIVPPQEFLAMGAGASSG